LIGGRRYNSSEEAFFLNTMSSNNPAEKANIMVFAPERVGLKAPGRIETRNFDISFEPLQSARRFDEYDGVVVFQRTFENFKYVSSEWNSGWRQETLSDALDRRTKEMFSLTDKGGFVCFVLHQPLIDDDHGRTFRDTDLVKRVLHGPDFYREDLNSRVVDLEPAINEFERFLKSFGGAHSVFKYFKGAREMLEIRPLARWRGSIVGMVFGTNAIFVPSMLPTWTADIGQEYFWLLVDAVLTTLKKLRVEIPEWAKELQFHEEPGLHARKQELSESLTQIEKRLTVLDRMKRILISDSASLVADVAFVLEVGLGLLVDATEEFREDLRVLSDDRSTTVMLCEVKGVNRGVKREHINQADSHRERANLPPDFPTILIVNTGIKSARNVTEKDQAVDPDQVRHAVRTHVLILRTLDLLQLANLSAAGRLTKEEIRGLLLTNVGWLRVDANRAVVEKE
jgi:hypothetical protein